MNFHILTLFPDMVMDGLNTSIIGRAIANSLLTIEAVNIRDFAVNKHNRVDDYTYGGGAGMLMQAEPVYLAYKSIEEKCEKKPRVVYLSPQGKTFSQDMAEEFAKEEELVFLCGHYEGIDRESLGGNRDRLRIYRRLCFDGGRTSVYGYDRCYFEADSGSFAQQCVGGI